MLADGTCDPSTATLSTAVKDKGDKLLLAKRFYSDTTFDRGHGNNEMPNQPPPKLTCDDTNPFGCQARARPSSPELARSRPISPADSSIAPPHRASSSRLISPDLARSRPISPDLASRLISPDLA